MENNAFKNTYVVGFFTGYKKSPYQELDTIIGELNKIQNITAYSFSKDSEIHASTTHVVMRHATGYYRHYSSFKSLLDFLDKRGIKTINPSSLLRWNTSKHYLNELSLQKLRVPETMFVRCDEFQQSYVRKKVDSFLTQFPKVVLKPAVSAGGWNTFLLDRADIADIELKISDVDCNDWMIQAFIPEIATLGEWSVIFVGGHLFQVVKKSPATGEFKSQPEYGGTFSIVNDIPGTLLQNIRDEILKQLYPEPFYVRVDLIPTLPFPVLIEIECIEPDLLLNDRDKILHYTELLYSHIKSG